MTDRGRPRSTRSAPGFGYTFCQRDPRGSFTYRAPAAAMIYVDTAPGKPPLDSSQEGDTPMVWEEVVAEENLDALTEGEVVAEGSPGAL